jgi:hypothetical protein
MVFLMVQCTKHPAYINENELITRVSLTFTDSLDLSKKTFLYCVNDGEFGDRKDTVSLYSNTKYHLEINFYNAKSAANIDTITREIEEEGAEHQIFVLCDKFTDFKYLDKDENGAPIGIQSALVTGDSSPDLKSVQILLIHKPNKYALNVSQNNPAAAVGETDVDIIYNLSVDEKNF